MGLKSDSERRGMIAEDIAVDFLRLRGYIILERNYRYKKAEIDIIARQNGTVVFIEVKLRKADPQGATPLEAVDTKKQRLMTKGAIYYASKQFGHGINLRFDVVGLTLDEYRGTMQISHIVNAFKADERYYF